MAEYNRPAGVCVGAVPENDQYQPATTRTQSQAKFGGGNKYGELAPKRKPLISKDHERAFFDSADWALCKQGAGVEKSTVVAVESLRPKLKRTPHHKLPPRMPACTSGGDWDMGTMA